jgi:hypothetical protein
MVEKILDEIAIFIYCIVPGLIVSGAIKSQETWISVALFFVPYCAYAAWRVGVKIYDGSSLSRHMQERRERELEASALAVQAREQRLAARQAAKQAAQKDKREDSALTRQRVVDVMCFVVGPVLVVVNTLYIFASRRKFHSSVFDVDAEYYGVAIGVALIAFGILRRRWNG